MMYPDRIALVSEHASPIAHLGGAEAGGQNVYVEELARRLAALGCLVDVYTRRDHPTVPDAVEVAPRFTVHHVAAGPPEPMARDEMFTVMPEFAEGLLERWARDRPDVAHAHFWMSGWASLICKRRLGVPFVQTFHALGSVKRRHQGTADTSPPERIATERLLLRHADRVLATCADEVDELERLGGSTSRISVVPCGVGDEFVPWGPSDRSPRRARHRIVSVSRLVPRKGIADVIAALPRLADRFDVELIVAGGPNERPGVGYHPADDEVLGDPEAVRLAALASELGVRDRCRFVGRLDHSATAAMMRSADVVVCTPWYEPFGIVPVEAMACGVPVVGSAVGGLLDTVVDGQTGLLVPPRSPDDIAVAVGRMLAHPTWRRGLGRAGARRAAAYRWPRVTGSILDVYASVLGADQVGRPVAAGLDRAVLA
jgi:D-inositol-3-phosphate glycosyltransferase